MRDSGESLWRKKPSWHCQAPGWQPGVLVLIFVLEIFFPACQFSKWKPTHHCGSWSIRAPVNVSELRRKFPSKTGIKGRKETGSCLPQSPDNTKREKNHRVLSRKCPALSEASAEPLKLRTLIDKGSYILLGFPGSAVVKNLPADATDLGLIPELGRSLGVGNVSSLQDFCLKNPIDGEAWWAIIHRVTKSWKWLSDWTHTHTHTHTPSAKKIVNQSMQDLLRGAHQLWSYLASAFKRA